MKYVGVIPARYASVRFPGKPLAQIGSKTMIRRVFEQAMKCKILSYVVVATDNQEIFDHVESFGNALMTSPLHQSGTDRCWEAANQLAGKLHLSETDVIVNIQGDEPFIQPEQIDALVQLFDNQQVEIGTLVRKISDSAQLGNENVVKVVFDDFGKALYFSRLPVPFQRGRPQHEWLNHHDYYSHLGLYAYRFETLRNVAGLSAGALEMAESLEQLRWLQQGIPVHVAPTSLQSPAIDTPEDLLKIAAYLRD